MPRRHALRLFFFNLALFLTIGGFAGFEVLDFLPGDGDLIVVIIVLGAIAAAVSTAVHLRAGKWTAVDSISERFGGHAPRDKDR